MCIFRQALATWAVFAEVAAARCLAIVAGASLTRLADDLAARLNITGGWIGLILLVTSPLRFDAG